jgi:NADPH:quinone reductase-like Zn-dependent oxidoreductase
MGAASSFLCTQADAIPGQLIAGTLPAVRHCIVYGKEDGTLREETQQLPTVTDQPDHVWVRVHAVGLNPVDAKNVVGDKFPHHWRIVRSWVRSALVAGTIPGFDYAGTVAALPKHGRALKCNADDLPALKVGDAVFGTMPASQGTLATYIAAPRHQMWHKPESLSFVQAAALPLVGLTAYQCLQPHMAFRNEKDGASNASASSVLVVGGSGGTGHVAIQVARNLGARCVTAVCSTRNVAFCHQQGATYVVDYTANGGDKDTLRRHLLETGPACPFDIVLDCVSSADPRDQQTFSYRQLLQQDVHIQKLLNEAAVYRRLGGPSLDWLRAGMEQKLGWTGVWKYTTTRRNSNDDRLFWIRFPHTSLQLQALSIMANQGQLLPKVEKVYSFSATDVERAFDDLLSRRVRGKIVVELVKETDQQKD